jgi:hypothetical protein
MIFKLEKPMKHLICSILLAGLFAGCTTMGHDKSRRKDTIIVHSVFFTLKHDAASAEASAFFARAEKLAAIPGVIDFQVLKEVSPKNTYTFGFSMKFAMQADYDRYNNHLDHVGFVQEVWMKEVAEFQEIDYILAD